MARTTKKLDDALPALVDDERETELASPAGHSLIPSTLGGALTLGNDDYEVADIVTRSVLRQQAGIPFYVFFESSWYEAPPLDGPSSMAPPMLADVINIATGEYQVLIGNAVLISELERHYKADGFVNRYFAIVGAPHPDETKQRRYRVYSIREIKPKRK